MYKAGLVIGSLVVLWTAEAVPAPEASLKGVPSPVYSPANSPNVDAVPSYSGPNSFTTHLDGGKKHKFYYEIYPNTKGSGVGSSQYYSPSGQGEISYHGGDGRQTGLTAQHNYAPVDNSIVQDYPQNIPVATEEPSFMEGIKNNILSVMGLNEGHGGHQNSPYSFRSPEASGPAHGGNFNPQNSQDSYVNAYIASTQQDEEPSGVTGLLSSGFNRMLGFMENMGFWGTMMMMLVGAPLLLPMTMLPMAMMALGVLGFPILTLTVPGPVGRTLSSSLTETASVAREVIKSEECIEKLTCAVGTVARKLPFENWIITKMETNGNEFFKRISRSFKAARDGSDCKQFVCRPVSTFRDLLKLRYAPKPKAESVDDVDRNTKTDETNQKSE